MLQASVSAKLILFGEWAVTQGLPGIATTLGASFLVQEQTADHSEVWRLSNGKHQAQWAPGEAIPSGFFELAFRMIERLQRDSAQPMSPSSLSLIGEWRLEEGLGSSSALALGLLLIHQARTRTEQALSKQELWELARTLIRSFQSPHASGLDLAAQTWGGTVLLEGDHITPLPLDIPSELWVIHTGQKMSTAHELSRRRPDHSFCHEISQSVGRFLRESNWIQAIEEHFHVLQEWGVVPLAVTEARQEWMSQGWIRALKTTGAGGGDALLAWVPNEPPSQEALRLDLAKRGWWPSPYPFEERPWKILQT